MVLQTGWHKYLVQSGEFTLNNSNAKRLLGSYCCWQKMRSVVGDGDKIKLTYETEITKRPDPNLVSWGIGRGWLHSEPIQR